MLFNFEGKTPEQAQAEVELEKQLAAIRHCTVKAVANSVASAVIFIAILVFILLLVKL